LVAPDGSVIAKAFTGDLRHRASGSTLVFEQLGRAGQPEIRVETPELVATVVPSTTRLFGGQEAALLVELRIAPGWHVYGPDVAAPSQGVAVRLEPAGPDLVAEQSYDFPPPALVRLDALDATLPTYEGKVVITGRFRLRWSPPPSLFA